VTVHSQNANFDPIYNDSSIGFLALEKNGSRKELGLV
jgi:hypothetical protein